MQTIDDLPSFRPTCNLSCYRLERDFSITVAGQAIFVPQGFTFDGASIPSFAWWAIFPPFHPKVMIPSLVHDWLYTTHQLSRAKSDQLFLALLEQAGISPRKAKLMHWAVQKFGKKHWQRSDKDIKQLRFLYHMHQESEIVSLFGFPLELILEEHASSE